MESKIAQKSREYPVDAMKAQEQLRSLVEQRQKLDSQINEITMAKEEIDLLEKDATIYKLIGPLMIKQDLPEVKQNVGARLAFLNDRVSFYDKEIDDMRAKNSSYAQAAAISAMSKKPPQTPKQ